MGINSCIKMLRELCLENSNGWMGFFMCVDSGLNNFVVDVVGGAC